MTYPCLPAIQLPEVASNALDSTKSCLPYTSGQSYDHEVTTNVRGALSAAVSRNWLGSLTGV